MADKTTSGYTVDPDNLRAYAGESSPYIDQIYELIRMIIGSAPNSPSCQRSPNDRWFLCEKTFTGLYSPNKDGCGEENHTRLVFVLTAGGAFELHTFKKEDFSSNKGGSFSRWSDTTHDVSTVEMDTVMRELDYECRHSRYMSNGWVEHSTALLWSVDGTYTTLARLHREKGGGLYNALRGILSSEAAFQQSLAKGAEGRDFEERKKAAQIEMENNARKAAKRARRAAAKAEEIRQKEKARDTRYKIVFVLSAILLLVMTVYAFYMPFNGFNGILSGGGDPTVMVSFLLYRMLPFCCATFIFFVMYGLNTDFGFGFFESTGIMWVLVAVAVIAVVGDVLTFGSFFGIFVVPVFCAIIDVIGYGISWVTSAVVRKIYGKSERRAPNRRA